MVLLRSYFLLALITVFGFATLKSQSLLDQQKVVDQGIEAYYQQDFERAERLLLAASQQISKTKDPVLAAKAVCFLAECHFEMDQKRLARREFHRAKAMLAKILPDHPGIDFHYRTLQGIAVTTPGDFYPDKYPFYQELIDWVSSRKKPSIRALAAAEYSEGSVDYWAYRDSAAIEHIKRSIEILKPLGDDPFLSNNYSALARMHADLQDYYHAVIYQKIAVELLLPDRTPETYFRQLINLAGYQFDNRSLADVNTTIDQAKRFGTEHAAPDNDFWMNFYEFKQEYFNEQMMLDSFAFYQRAGQEFYDRLPTFKAYNQYHNHLNFGAVLAIRNRDFERADVLLQEAKRLFLPEHADQDYYYNSQFLASKIALSQGENDQAIAMIQDILYTKALKPDSLPDRTDPHYLFKAEELSTTPRVINYLKDKASYYTSKQGASPDELGWLDHSTRTIKLADSLTVIAKQKNQQPGLRKQLDEISQELRKIEVENLYRLYQRTEDLEYLVAAINASELVKHLSISEKLHANQLTESFGIPADSLLLERDYEKRLARHVGHLSHDLPAEELASLRDSIQFLTTLQRAYREKITREHPRYAALLYTPESISLEGIRRELLTEDEVLLHYLERDDFLYVIGITQEEEIFRKIDLSRALPDLLPELLTQLENPERVDNRIFVTLRRLYREIIAPLEDFIGDRQLLIVPDAHLWYIPFHALITEDRSIEAPASAQPYLILAREIRHLLSLRVGLLQQRTATDFSQIEKTVLSISPFTDDARPPFGQLASSLETENALKELIATDQGHFLHGEAANLQAFFALAPTVKLIHIFSHASIDELRPDSSYIALAGLQPHELQKLTARDVYNMTMKAKLAVLAACETGGGKLFRGQGVANLARAFTYAGCENLLVNLWTSHEMAVEKILAEFYPLILQEGESFSTATAIAQRNYINNNIKSAHPGYWAMTIYIGAHQTMEKISFWTYGWFLIVPVFLGLFIWLYRQKQLKGALK